MKLIKKTLKIIILWEECSVANIEVWWGYQQNEQKLYVYYFTTFVGQENRCGLTCPLVLCLSQDETPVLSQGSNRYRSTCKLTYLTQLFTGLGWWGRLDWVSQLFIGFGQRSFSGGLSIG